MKALTQATVDKAAAALANVRRIRYGYAPADNVLDVLPPKLKQEARIEAEEALQAVGLPDLLSAIVELVTQNGGPIDSAENALARDSHGNPDSEMLPEDYVMVRREDFDVLVKMVGA